MMLGANTTTGAKSRKKAAQPQPSTIEIITRVNDYWQQHHSPKVRAFWDEAAYHTGNMEAVRTLGVARWADYSQKWARHNKWQGATEHDPAKWKYKKYGEGQDYVLFGDWQICFQTYIDLYLQNPDPYKIRRAIEVMDYEVRQPQCDFWWWADALYMVMPVMTKLYRVTGETKYLDKLYENFRWSDELMYDNEEHLYYRDAKYIYPKATTRNGGKDFWARGDGWVLAGLARVLSDMPADYVHRPFFEQRFRELADAVRRCQQPEGYWTRSMLDPQHAEGPETSGTAFFCYGLLWGMNNGLLSKADYEPAMNKAWQYLTQKALQHSGAVGFVQPIGERAIPGQQLSEKNEANFGVGAFLLAACEHLRYEDAPTAQQKPLTVVVSNNSNEFRQQVVEISAAEVCRRLGIQGGRQFIVCDAAGLEVPFQLTHDSLLLIDCGVRPQGEARFTITRGTPKTYQTVCFGQLYPERKDDYAWENDRAAYRVYGPALGRTGEKSYGTDVWTKNTPELVVEQRYWTEDVVMMPEVERLRKENRHRGDSLYRTISYHHDHGRGLDLYKVGPTLGCGAPALVVADSLAYPYCFRNYTVLDNGPLRTSVQLDYAPRKVAADSVTEHRIITLDKGSNFNRMTVWYEGLTRPVGLASGVVLHDDAAHNVITAPDYVAYADPTDNPRVNNSQLFVAVLFPEGINETMQNAARGRDDGLVIGRVSEYMGQRYTYLFGSAWSKHDVRTLQEWRERIEWTLRSHKQPLQVELK